MNGAVNRMRRDALLAEEEAETIGGRVGAEERPAEEGKHEKNGMAEISSETKTRISADRARMMPK